MIINVKIIIWCRQRFHFNTNAIIPVSSRGAKKIPSLCSEQAEQSHTINCHCEERSDEAISTFFPKRLPRYARNDANRMRLPRPFRARNDNVKIYIAFILVRELKIIREKTSPLAISD